MKLAGYEVFRFGAHELTNGDPTALLRTFFRDLLAQHHLSVAPTFVHRQAGPIASDQLLDCSSPSCRARRGRSRLAGKLDGEKQRAPVWVEFIKANEPRLITFHEYVSEDGSEVEYVQVHTDTDSFEHHMRLLAEKSDRSYTETLEGTTNIRIYGQPTEAILEMLDQAAGPGVPVTVLPEYLGGFTRP